MNSILFASLMNGASWGGSEELWYKTALFALQQGRKVGCVVYSWAEKEERLQKLEKAGAKIYRLPNKGVGKKTRLQKLRHKYIKKFPLRNAIRKLPFNKYDITVFSLGEFENTHSTWKNVFKLAGKYIVLYHNYKEGQVLKPSKAAILQHWMDHSKLNLFASRRIKEVLHQFSHIHISRGEILLNPITFDPPAEMITYPPLLHGNYVFAMLAALDVNRKAQDNLVNALSTSHWKERNWELHLYGEGRDYQLLKDLIDNRQLTGKVFLKGHTDSPQSVLERSHLLLQVTHMDAMPLSVVEAMAVGRPVVVSRIGDMPDWVIDGENGWISENASVESIDAIMEKAWQQRNSWSVIGKNAKDYFLKRFPPSVEERLLEQIDTAANR